MPTNNDGICDYCKKPIEKDHDRTLVISPTLRVHKKLYHGDCYVDFIAINQIFAELDKMIEELDDSLRTIGEITLDAEKYEALKKQHEVPR
jgi:hypothetical protein